MGWLDSIGDFISSVKSTSNEPTSEVVIKQTQPADFNPVELFGQNLLKLVDLALVDSILTTKEKELLISVAKSNNNDVAKFTQYLDSEVMKKGVKVVECRNSDLKTSRLGGKASKLQDLVDLAISDGKITTEERTLLSEEAVKLGLSNQDFNRVLDVLIEQAKQQEVNQSKTVIETLTAIDYDMVLKGIDIAVSISKIPCLILTPAVKVLKGAANQYNASTDENKDEKYLSYLWDNTTPAILISAIEPVESYIPHAPQIIGVMKLLDSHRNVM